MSLTRKTPLRSHKPLARCTMHLRQRKPKTAKPKRAAREAADKHMADLCHGQACYLLLDCCSGNRETVVPCHSNQHKHGKGAGIKALHCFTVPGCSSCHAEIDQGRRFSREEKFAIWDDAFRRWEPVRRALLDA